MWTGATLVAYPQQRPSSPTPPRSVLHHRWRARVNAINVDVAWSVAGMERALESNFGSPVCSLLQKISYAKVLPYAGDGESPVCVRSSGPICFTSSFSPPFSLLDVK
jgi:hypothetical protein